MLCFICVTRLVSICTSVPLQRLVVRLNLDVCLKAGRKGLYWGVMEEREDMVSFNPWLNNLLDPVRQLSTKNNNTNLKNLCLAFKVMARISSYSSIQCLESSKQRM